MDSGGGTADYSGTTSDFEDAFLSDTDADDTYEVRAEGWISSGSIAGIVFAMHPDGTLETFETDLTGIPNFGGQITMVIVEKVGSTYTLSQ